MNNNSPINSKRLPLIPEIFCPNKDLRPIQNCRQFNPDCNCGHCNDSRFNECNCHHCQKSYCSPPYRRKIYFPHCYIMRCQYQTCQKKKCHIPLRELNSTPSLGEKSRFPKDKYIIC